MAAPQRSVDFAELQDRLGYHFTDLNLLQQALTHSSAGSQHNKPDYERLEFLGDRVLALFAADTLMDAYPDADQGGLASRLNAMVRKETCADVATALGLGEFIILSQSETLSGGRNKEAILADICEAVLGAIYRDGGIDAARAVFDSQWTGLVAALEVAPRDAKSALQEWAQGRGFALPRYRLVSREGPDHMPHFVIEVSVGAEAPCKGEGTSKKEAERAAARACLIHLGVWPAADGVEQK